MVLALWYLFGIAVGHFLYKATEEETTAALAFFSVVWSVLALVAGEVMSLSDGSALAPGAFMAFLSIWIGAGGALIESKVNITDLRLPDRCHFCESLTYGEDYYFPREDSQETIDVPACFECQDRRDALRAHGALRRSYDHRYTLDQSKYDNP